MIKLNEWLNYSLMQIIVRRLQVLLTKGKEMLYLMTHSTHFIYGYMVSDVW